MSRVAHLEALEKIISGHLHELDGYLEVPVSVFMEKIDVNVPELPSVDFYILKDKQATLVKRAEQRIPPVVLAIHESIWIRKGDLEVLRAFATNLLVTPSPGSATTATTRMQAVRRSAIVLVDDLFKHPTPENIDKSTKIVGSFVHILMKDPKAYFLLANLSSHDPYTLQHSVGTAINSIMLAKKLGITDDGEIMDVGTAGLLHDIGKTKVKKEIINKQGKLTDEEWQEMKMHSQFGYDILEPNASISTDVKRAVLEHHEDNKGMGYPNQLTSDRLHMYSKIVRICDMFNALTTDRSYSKARTTFDALRYMRDELSYKMDDDLFRLMVMLYGGDTDVGKPS